MTEPVREKVLPLEFKVSEVAHGQRLDVFLAELLPAGSRRRARELCEAGSVRRNGKSARAGEQLVEGDRVEVFQPAVPCRLRPELAGGTQLAILYEDEWLLVVEKPRGMPSIRLRPEDPVTLADLLVAVSPACETAGADMREGGLVHRLDTWTSGVLLAAKTRQAWETLRSELAAHRIAKSYRALVEGVLEPGSQLISRAIVAERNSPVVRIAEPEEAGSPAETRVTPERSLGRFSLVRAETPSARRHQIRVHLASVGHPLVGDTLYGSQASLPDVFALLTGEPFTDAVPAGAGSSDGFLLHAERICFRHPFSGEIGDVECIAASSYFSRLDSCTRS